MTSYKFTTPVLIIAFNRPDVTQRVFDEIRKAKPLKLFLAVDGPRENRPEERELVEQVRNIAKQVNWSCEVKTLFQEKNVGVSTAPAKAISWFFEHVEEGIIFEDDCLPHPSFFRFCQEMLAKYRTNEKIMLVSGDNFQFGKKHSDKSYYFSIYPSTWGWATWRRAWKHFDPNLSGFPTFRDSNSIASITPEKDEQRVWLDTFRKEYYGEWKTWDYEWVYAIWSRGGLSVIPNVNLISNIGFGENATHNFSTESKYANIKTEEITFPLSHPKEMVANREADRFTFETLFADRKPLKKKLYDLVLRKTPRWMKEILKMILRYKKDRAKKALRNKYSAFSMIPRDTFVDNLRLAETFSRVPGCVVECGVWRGGMTAAMAELLGSNRSYYLFDSFEGLPPAQEIDGYRAKAWQNDTSSKIYFDNCSAEIEFAERAMALSGAKKVHFMKGWFSDTIPSFAPDSPIAVLRLDGDWYESTMQCLEGLYRYVAKGGVIIIDDYYTWVGCSKAVHDFLSRHQLPDVIRHTAKGVCYIVKQS